MRLCVNQDGGRIEDRNINLLHVMTNENFAEFVNTLQKEIEEETGVKFDILQPDLFSGMVFEETKTREMSLIERRAAILLSHLAGEGFIKADEPISEVTKLLQEPEAVKTEVVELVTHEGDITPATVMQFTVQEAVVVQSALTYDDAQQFMAHFRQNGYVVKSGRIKGSVEAAIQTGALDLPPHLEGARVQIENIVCRIGTKPPIRDAPRDITMHLKKEVTASSKFLELWSKIKQKTIYRIQIDGDELIHRSVKGLRDMKPTPKARITTQTADIQIGSPGVTYIECSTETATLSDSYLSLPNILTIINSQALIKHATVAEILKQSGRLGDFLNNPQVFIKNTTQIILDVRWTFAVDGISYRKLYGVEYYMQGIFDSAELIANLDRSAAVVEHSVYDYIIYDSIMIEKPFVLNLDDDSDVKMFFRLLSRFRADTPVGTYNPDQMVYVELGSVKKLYFVLEAKGKTNEPDLRGHEDLKIYCGKEHFKVVDSGAELHVAPRWKDPKARNI